MVDKELNTVKRTIYLAMMNNRDNTEVYEGIYSVYQDLKNGKVGMVEAMELASSYITEMNSRKH